MNAALRIIGLLLAVAGVAYLPVKGGMLAFCVDIPSLAFVLLVVFGTALCWEGSALLQLPRAATRRFSAQRDQAAFAQAERALNLLIPLCYAAGFLGAAFAILHFQTTLDDPANWLLFPPADALLPPIYGLLLAEGFLRPLRTQLRFAMSRSTAAEE